jgi:hypothetical protein
LAGPRDKPTGWLERFGLTRPIPGEDWHIQLVKTPPVADGKTVVNDNGKTASLDNGKQTTGENVSKNSVELAQNQRAQEKIVLRLHKVLNLILALIQTCICNGR